METKYYTKTIKHSLRRKEAFATSFVMPYDFAVEHNPTLNLEKYFSFNSESDNYVKPQYLMNPRGDNALTEFIYDNNNILQAYSCSLFRELFVLMRDNLWDDFCNTIDLSVDREKIADLVEGLDKRDPAQYNKIEGPIKDALRFYGCIDHVVYNAEKEATQVFVSDINGRLALQDNEKHSYLYLLQAMDFDHGYDLSDYSLIANLYPVFITPSVVAQQVEDLSFGSIAVEINGIAQQKQDHLQSLFRFLTQEDYEYIEENTGADDRFYLSIKWDADGKIDDIIYHTIPVYKFASS